MLPLQDRGRRQQSTAPALVSGHGPPRSSTPTAYREASTEREKFEDGSSGHLQSDELKRRRRKNKILGVQLGSAYTQQSAKKSLTALWNSFHFPAPPHARLVPFTSLAERCQKALQVVQLGLPCITPTTHLGLGLGLELG